MLFELEPRKVAPGVAHLPGWLDIGSQARLVERFRATARELAGTPLAMRKPTLKSGEMSVHMLHLGQYWRPYEYVDHVEGHKVPPLPDDLARLAQAALKEAAQLADELQPWVESYRPDMALINYYGPGARMGLHVDAEEESAAPIVSLSVGDEALFRIGGTENRNRPWDDIALASGDAVVFGGPKRLAYHGVPKIRPGTLPPGCGLREGRINVTFRQVR